MEWKSGEAVELMVAGVRLEGACFGPSPDDAPTLLLLHEGLGCVALWRDFPQKLSEITGFGVFTYSRQGYGKSDPVTLPRPLNYMNVEADKVVGPVMDVAGLKKVILVGHSDGASIAAAYAGMKDDPRLKGVVLMAPHFFAEDISIRAITSALEAYKTTDLRQKLSKYHADVDGAFHGWCDGWLNPEFRNWNIEADLQEIDVPVLFIQGREDAYGTLAQLEALKGNLSSLLVAEIYEDCGHSPALEKQERVLEDIATFVKSLKVH
ncbi:alpha/beta fold hydrolase [Sneathiella sp. P13V-1]|uniref:alpha/beta fold hydrolase n=1 Tax=Sneathiella sp. P13V-1 TaxID=2697366 RepID=UPI00187B8AB1|nr:alpha/beta hydrolase [Sneathiella sp. P13V-1]MBE7637466.1 alpha/beta fold hydrolase [Sneathiella sp. P13V-1]